MYWKGSKRLLPDSAILLVDCPDRRGLVATISEFLYILHADQHQDNNLGLFFMRIECSLDGFDLSRDDFLERFTPIAREFSMHWRLEYSAEKPNVAIFVSHYLHCLVDLLHRYQIGELPCRIAIVVANHPDAEEHAKFHGIPFHLSSVNAANKPDAERRQIALLEREKVELIVLARYMQVLSPQFVDRYPRKIINVHHSFLPAFSGAKPYHAAFERGVKLIGATSHYVTGLLDDGPIIEQDVDRVSHRDQVADLIAKGRDLERTVLSRAVRWHLQHRILSYANKTVVFD